MDLNLRKSLHIKLFRDTHAEFRVTLLRMGLSMQEVFEEFAQLVVAQDPEAIRILNELVRKKRDREISRISETDAESLYDIIESSSPGDSG